MRIFDYINFYTDYLRFLRKLSKSQNKRGFKSVERVAKIGENTETTEFDRHYLFHLAWAARKIVALKPKKHFDFSSSLYFSTMISSIVPTEFYDFRPVKIQLSNFSAKQGDLTRLRLADNSIPSLSCMHVIEHIGLGRYGDKVDSNGDLKAINELKRVLAKKGNLFVVVPIGTARIVFNAHRIYSKNQVLKYFKDLTIKEFALIPQESKDGDIVINPSKSLLNRQKYGCGCFWFQK